MNNQLLENPGISLPREKRRQKLSRTRLLPSVSVFMPFDPKVTNKKDLVQYLSQLTEEVSEKLLYTYPDDLTRLTIYKFKTLVKNLNFATLHRSIAIFISPVFEKVYYLNIDLKRSILIGRSFQLKEIIHQKKSQREFHTLLLDEAETRLFINNTYSSIRITRPTSGRKTNIKIDPNGRPTPHSGPRTSENSDTSQYISQINRVMNKVLKGSMLPVIFLGKKQLRKEFIAQNQSKQIWIEFITKKDLVLSQNGVGEEFEKYPELWQEIKEKMLQYKIDHALEQDRLITGFANILYQSDKRKNALLLIEEGSFELPVSRWGYDDIMPFAFPSKYSCIKDPMDKIIENVLLNHGDVEKVSEGQLKEYEGIALIYKNNSNIYNRIRL